jgi:hypothetical protein
MKAWSQVCKQFLDPKRSILFFSEIKNLRIMLWNITLLVASFNWDIIVSIFFVFQFPVVIKKNPGLGFSITGGLGLTSPLEKRDNVSWSTNILISMHSEFLFVSQTSATESSEAISYVSWLIITKVSGIVSVSIIRVWCDKTQTVTSVYQPVAHGWNWAWASGVLVGGVCLFWSCLWPFHFGIALLC